MTGVFIGIALPMGPTGTAPAPTGIALPNPTTRLLVLAPATAAWLLADGPQQAPGTCLKLVPKLAVRYKGDAVAVGNPPQAEALIELSIGIMQALAGRDGHAGVAVPPAPRLGIGVAIAAPATPDTPAPVPGGLLVSPPGNRAAAGSRLGAPLLLLAGNGVARADGSVCLAVEGVDETGKAVGKLGKLRAACGADAVGKVAAAAAAAVTGTEAEGCPKDDAALAPGLWLRGEEP
jgi:hypothetical protein